MPPVSIRPDSHTLPTFAKLLAAHKGDWMQASESAPFSGIPSRVIEIAKAAVDVATTGSWSALSNYQSAMSAFIDSLKGSSALFTMLPSFVPLPIKGRAVVSAVNANAAITGEGHAKMLTSLNLTGETLDPVKAVGMVIVSAELARMGGDVADAAFRTELRKAAIAAADSKFLAILAAAPAAITPLTSSGTTAAAILADMKAMLAGINMGAQSRLFWIVPPRISQAAVTIGGETGLLFPDMVVTGAGGSMLGIPAIISDEIAFDHLLLIDASQLGGSMDTIALNTFKHATLQLETAPDSPPTASTVTVNLWQHNLIGLVAEMFFGVKPLRSAIASELSGVQWAAPDSP